MLVAFNSLEPLKKLQGLRGSQIASEHGWGCEKLLLLPLKTAAFKSDIANVAELNKCFLGIAKGRRKTKEPYAFFWRQFFLRYV